MELWLGFDPGGANSFGVAAIFSNEGDIDLERSAWATVSNAVQAHQWATETAGEFPPSGTGIDTLMFWSPGEGGWREADHFLRKHYSAARATVMSPNALQGSMAVQGMCLAMLLRQSFPEHPISETHPKVLYLALSGDRYPTKDTRLSRATELR